MRHKSSDFLCVTLKGSMNKNGACERLSLQGSYVHKNTQTFNDKRVWRRVRDEPKEPASSVFVGLGKPVFALPRKRPTLSLPSLEV